MGERMRRQKRMGERWKNDCGSDSSESEEEKIDKRIII